MFDGLLALHRDDQAAAVRRLALDIDDRELFQPIAGPCRPWYAALWAEVAVLAQHPDAAARVARSRYAARDTISQGHAYERLIVAPIR